MNQPDITKPVLITGGSGYVASWIVKNFLVHGYTVRTTLRNKQLSDKITHLQQMAEEFPGKLFFYEANLLQKGTFTEAMKDCEIVVHTASPFFIQGIKDAQAELINPAVEGTRNVLNSVNETPSVKRVVLTSSCAAIYGDAADIYTMPNGMFTEEIWNTTSSVKHQPYSYSKTLAEQEAWKMVKEQDRWDLVTINPGLVMGPSLTARADSTSIDLLISLLNGKFKTGVPKLYMPLVDVRNVSDAHYYAAINPNAKGRYILVNEVMDILGMASVLRDEYPNMPIPKKAIPTWLFKLLGPMFGYTRKAVKQNSGIDMQFDNTKSITDLGISYIDIHATLVDHAEQLFKNRLVNREKP